MFRTDRYGLGLRMVGLLGVANCEFVSYLA